MNQLSFSSDPSFSSCVNPLLQTRDISQPREPTRSVEDSSTNPHLDTTWAKNTPNLPNTDPLASPQPSMLLQSPISRSQNERTILGPMKEWLRKATSLLPQISPLRLSSQSPAILHLDNTKPNHPSPSFYYWHEIIQLIFLNLSFRLPLLYSNRVDRVFPKVHMSQLAFSAHGGEEWVSEEWGSEKSVYSLRQVRQWHFTPISPIYPCEYTGLFAGYTFSNAPRPPLIFTLLSQVTPTDPVFWGEQWAPPHSLEWDIFVIELIKEWKTFSILSVLLIS